MLFDRNVTALKENGMIVLLDVPLDIIKNRLQSDTKRPLLQRPDKDKAMAEMYNARLPLYKKACEYIINADKAPTAVAEDIKGLIFK